MIGLLAAVHVRGQDIQLLFENFEFGGAGWILNGDGVGTNTGDNQWIINNVYSGAPTYPNTTTQDITTGGTIGFGPTGTYLHIHDQPSGILNGNYDTGAASDRFAYSYGVCTYGMTDVHFSFFYLCEGAVNDFGSIYYSIDDGPWTQFGLAQYNGMTSWQYVDISDPIFENVGSLRFGFRWQNDSGAPPYTQSLGIDDVQIVATYAPADPVTIDILSISPTAVCENSFVTIEYQLSDTLCDGTYQIELSNSSGAFTGAFGSWVFSINYPNTTGFVSVLLPAAAGEGDCYRFRINRTSPPPVITGEASFCFEIIECPNVITTMQPVITLDTNAVCVGSAIDIPFYSTGVYAASNDYIAQLSDADGTFPADPVEIGSSDDNNNYDPMLGDIPGSVGGLVPEVEPGCNYFIRIISTNPDAIGSVWGPFCIQQCDITTNDMEDLFFCVNECAIDPDGETQTIDVDVNTYDGAATYGPGNIFNTQLLSSASFAQIGPDGVLGSEAATGDCQLDVHVPCKDSLDMLGIPLGMNYMRVVATESSTPDNALGSLIRVTIGAYTNTPQVITPYSYPEFIPQYTFCVGETVALFFDPYDYFAGSTYMWSCNGIDGGDPFVSPSGANSNSLYVNLGGAGVLTFSIQETNNGCVSPWTPIMSINVLGNPVINISGPSNVCANDTVEFDVNFYVDTYYSWSTSAPEETIAFQDTSNNVLNISFTEPGSYTLSVDVLNECGSDSDVNNITILAAPEAEAWPDTTQICINESAALSVANGPSYSFEWFENGSSIGTSQNIDVSPESDTDYIVEVTGTGGCTDSDTVNVSVTLPDPPILLYDSICPGGMNDLMLMSDSLGAYLWSNGDNGVYTTVHDTGVYYLSVYGDDICPYLFEYHIGPLVPDPPILLLDSVCPGGNGNFPIQLEADAAGVYLWSTGQQLPVITVNDTGIYVLEIFMPDSVCQRTLQWLVIPDSCRTLPELNFWVPNSFTPNDDMVNDTFGPVFSDLSLLSQYRMLIFDRWGEVIFRSEDPMQKWYGNVMNGDYYASDGAYIWMIEFLQAERAEKTKVTGHVVMVR